MKVENLNILLKPTEFCNLDCQYCYAKPFREKYGKAKMTIEMFEKIITMATEHAKNVTVIWHGGEPTLMGVDWYYKCQEVLDKFSDTTFTQTLQTNGTMLDKSWAKLAKDTGIGFGSSFDVFDQGVRTSKMQTIENQLKSFIDLGVEIGIITVINKANYTKQIEIYDYFKNNFKITPSFNTIFSSIGTRLNDLEMTPQEYAIEFDKFFDYILHDTSANATSERTIEQYFRNVIGNRMLICTYCDCTYQWIGFSSTGDVYPCDFLCEDYYMGNIKDVNSITELYSSSGHKKYREDRNFRMTNNCSKCKYLDYCNGGCNSVHISYSGNNQRVNPDYCNIMRKNFFVAYKHIKTIDMYDETINRNFLRLLADESIFTFKEIQEFLVDKKIDFNWDEDINEYNVTDSIEFKIFRLFNPFKGRCIISDHSDYMAFKEPFNDLKDLEGLKESRLFNLEQRFEVEKDKILKLLNLEG